MPHRYCGKTVDVRLTTFRVEVSLDGEILASHERGIAAARRDLLEILDDRYQKKSTIIVAQLPAENWHDWIADPALADAILDRIVHNAYAIKLTGESQRKARGLKKQAP